VELRRAITLYEAGSLQFVACVVVNRTLQTPSLQALLRLVPGERLLLIGDECHYFGSEALHKALPAQARLRLGLSATPAHYFDTTRNDRIRIYFGDICFTYSLADALRDGVLTPYRYYVHPVPLTEEEAESYLELSQKISRLAAGRNVDTLEDTNDSGLNMLLFKRARLLASAVGKLGALRGILEAQHVEKYTLFYCGDGGTEDQQSEPTRQIDQVAKMLSELGWNVAHFTAEESRADRVRILDSFRIGVIDALVAMKCLDEGIDVPACRVAFILASSRNPRQFIQRRGRILRRSEGKSQATVHDFLPLLPFSEENGSDATERGLIVNELKRVAEFAALSINPVDALESLRPTLEKFDLYHHVFALK
jgi:superfamily II DNA or RNA helicase